MGCSPFRKSCLLTPPDSGRIFPNPNPARFRILRTMQVGKAVVAEVNYPDCWNYEGNKVLVFRDMAEAELRRRKTLDPHFSKHGGPLARFEPTEYGWTLAVEVARLSNAKEPIEEKVGK
jgi:hypothetical protein